MIVGKTPITNASIYLKSNNSGTCSNAAGEFSLKVRNLDNDTLIMSHISYQTQKIPIPVAKDNLTIYLQKGIFTLPEVNIADDDFVKSIVRNAYKNIKHHFRAQEAIIEGRSITNKLLKLLIFSKTRVVNVIFLSRIRDMKKRVIM